MKDRNDPKISQACFDAYDEYCHGRISRRSFMDRIGALAVGGISAGAIVESLLPDYAHSMQIPENDKRLRAMMIEYPSPRGAGTMGGYLVQPMDRSEKLPGIVVIHENRGLNPHIADVARRAAVEGYVVLAPDALFPLGGYPGNDDDGRALQRKRDRVEMQEDFVAAVSFLQNHDACTGKVGAVGFCFGGEIANMLAARVPDLRAAVPFYGRQVSADEVPGIRAPLLIHYAGNDERVNAGWPAYEDALREHGKAYTMHQYEGANHGFHNDSTARYDESAARLAWARTMTFFESHLKAD